MASSLLDQTIDSSLKGTSRDTAKSTKVKSTDTADQSIQAVEVSDLTVRFDQVIALDRITHRFEPGTSTAVMGVNGSGKTTLLECMAGLQKPTSGSIRGIPENLGYVCQHGPANWMPVTAGEVLAMGRYRTRGLFGRFRSQDRAVMRRAAERLDVLGLRNRSFGELSGGQQQRVRIAQALATEPDIIMLDEPLTGLDIPSQERILGMVKDCTNRGAIVIITTHHLDEARNCDSVLLLANHLVAAGTPDEVLTAQRLRDAFGQRLLSNKTGVNSGHDPGQNQEQHQEQNQEVILLGEHGHHDPTSHDPMHCDPHASSYRHS